MFNIKYPWAWTFCAFAALGACLYGYDGVYFNGVSTLVRVLICLAVLIIPLTI